MQQISCYMAPRVHMPNAGTRGHVITNTKFEQSIFLGVGHCSFPPRSTLVDNDNTRYLSAMSVQH